MDEKSKFILRTSGRTEYIVEGDSFEDVFKRIDGLRLAGKHWLPAYCATSYHIALQIKEKAYVNIDSIEAIEEFIEEGE